LSCGPPKPINLNELVDPCQIAMDGQDSRSPDLIDIESHNYPRLLWKKSYRCSFDIEPTAASGVLLIPIPENKVYLISANNGRQLAEIKFREPIVAPIVTADSLAVMNVGGTRLIVANWVTRKISWEAELDGAFAKPLIFENMLIWLDGMNYLRCFDVFEGKRIWDLRLDSPVYTVYEINSFGVVLFADDGLIECFDPRTGSRLWSFQAGARIKGEPAFFEDQLLLSTVDGMVARIGMQDGGLVWMRDLKSVVYGGPAADGSGVYLGTNDRRLVRFDYETGDILWEIKVEGPIKAGPSISDKIVIFVSLDHKAYFVDKLSGKILLAFESDGMLTTTPLVCGNRAYIAGEDMFLYCFELRAGE